MGKTRRGKLEYIKEYNRAHTRQLNIKLHTVYDADIIAHLNEIDESKAGYIKSLIREKIFEKNKGRAQNGNHIHN